MLNFHTQVEAGGSGVRYSVRVVLNYIANSRPAWSTWDPVYDNNNIHSSPLTAWPLRLKLLPAPGADWEAERLSSASCLAGWPQPQDTELWIHCQIQTPHLCPNQTSLFQLVFGQEFPFPLASQSSAQALHISRSLPGFLTSLPFIWNILWMSHLSLSWLARVRDHRVSGTSVFQEHCG